MKVRKPRKHRFPHGRFVTNDGGATLVEYGLLLGLLSIVAVGSIVTAASFVNGSFSKVESKMAANGFEAK